MNGEPPSSSNGSWIDTNVAFPGAIRKTIDSTSWESQFPAFYRTDNYWIQYCIRLAAIIKSEIGL